MTKNNMKKQEGKEDSITHIPFEITSESIRQYTSKPVSIEDKLRKDLRKALGMCNDKSCSVGCVGQLNHAMRIIRKYNKPLIHQETTKARIEEHKIILDTYDEWYQKLSAEHGVQQATPHTAFHQISEERLKELEQQERQNNE